MIQVPPGSAAFAMPHRSAKLKLRTHLKAKLIILLFIIRKAIRVLSGIANSA